MQSAGELGGEGVVYGLSGLALFLYICLAGGAGEGGGGEGFVLVAGGIVVQHERQLTGGDVSEAQLRIQTDKSEIESKSPQVNTQS